MRVTSHGGSTPLLGTVISLNLIFDHSCPKLPTKMSLTERIREKQQQIEQKAAEDRLALEKTRSEAKMQSEKETKEKEIQYKAKRERMLSESGILDALRQIEKELLGNTNHHLFISEDVESVMVNKPDMYDFENHDRVLFNLSWGYEKSQEREKEIYGYDYNSIHVYVDLDNGKIDIYGSRQTLLEDKSKWQNDKSIIEEALANAYLSPNKNKYAEPGWSIN